MTTESPVHVPPETHFSCTNCGKCCVYPWGISVTEREANLIAETSAYQDLEKQGFVPLPVAQESRQVGRRDNGVCLFHSDDGCNVHREVGLDSKPQPCQIYPFSLIRTPDGFFVSLSFSCPAVVAGRGETLTESLQDLTRMATTLPTLKESRASATLTLSEGFRIPWEQYLELEQEIFQTLRMVDPIRELVTLAVRFGILHEGKTRLSASDIEISATLAEEAMQLLPLFAAQAIATAENMDDPHERVEFVDALSRGDRPTSNLFEVSLPPFELRQTGSVLAKDALARHLRGVVFGKKLLVGPTLVARLLMVATSVAVFNYYLEALIAISGGSLAAEGRCLEWAFEVVEINLLTHSQEMAELFLQFERCLTEFRQA